jgi:chromosome segregation ATPase
VKRFEDSLDGQNESERKQTEQQINQFKHRIEQLSSDEQEVQARVIAAEEELRLEQAKLAQLHDALERIDKALEQLSHASRATD